MFFDIQTISNGHLGGHSFVVEVWEGVQFSCALFIFLVFSRRKTPLMYSFNSTFYMANFNKNMYTYSKRNKP